MKTMIRLTTGLILALFTFQVLAATNIEIAQRSSLESFNDSMQEKFGTTFSFENNTIRIVVNQSDLLSKGIPTLRTTGGINPDLTQETINKKPTIVTGIFGMHSAITLLFLVYTKTQVDKIHVEAFSIQNNKDENLMFSCDFTRDIYNKVSWDTFTPAEFTNKALNFKFSPWYSVLARKEIAA